MPPVESYCVQIQSITGPIDKKHSPVKDYLCEKATIAGPVISICVKMSTFSRPSFQDPSS